MGLAGFIKTRSLPGTRFREDPDRSASSISVEGELPVRTGNRSAAAVTSVASSATVVTLLAANTARRRALIFNDSATADLYIKFGSNASTTDFTHKVARGAAMPPEEMYNGIITGIWSAAVGSARITEIT